MASMHGPREVRFQTPLGDQGGVTAFESRQTSTPFGDRCQLLFNPVAAASPPAALAAATHAAAVTAAALVVDPATAAGAAATAAAAAAIGCDHKQGSSIGR